MPPEPPETGANNLKTHTFQGPFKWPRCQELNAGFKRLIEASKPRGGGVRKRWGQVLRGSLPVDLYPVSLRPC